jgi:hypothetical protein
MYAFAQSSEGSGTERGFLSWELSILALAYLVSRADESQGEIQVQATARVHLSLGPNHTPLRGPGGDVWFSNSSVHGDKVLCNMHLFCCMPRVAKQKLPFTKVNN